MLNSLNYANTFGISLAIQNTRLQRKDLLDFEDINCKGCRVHLLAQQ